jgi:hypothetical protein
MFPTVSISESQRSLSKVLSSANLGFTYILSNNKVSGILGNTKFLEFIESEGLLDQYEDWLLYKNKEVQTAFNEGNKIIKSDDFSETLSFKELCQK